MKNESLSQCGDTNECEILIRVGTKDREKGIKIGNQMINDLLSAVGFAQKNYDKITKTKNPNFKKSLAKIEKRLWDCIK